MISIPVHLTLSPSVKWNVRPLHSATWWLGVLALKAQFSGPENTRKVGATFTIMTEGVIYIIVLF